MKATLHYEHVILPSQAEVSGHEQSISEAAQNSQLKLILPRVLQPIAYLLPTSAEAFQKIATKFARYGAWTCRRLLGGGTSFTWTVDVLPTGTEMDQSYIGPRLVDDRGTVD
jgi:hypothetical protein